MTSCDVLLSTPINQTLAKRLSLLFHRHRFLYLVSRMLIAIYDRRNLDYDSRRAAGHRDRN